MDINRIGNAFLLEAVNAVTFKSHLRECLARSFNPNERWWLLRLLGLLSSVLRLLRLSAFMSETTNVDVSSALRLLGLLSTSLGLLRLLLAGLVHHQRTVRTRITAAVETQFLQTVAALLVDYECWEVAILHLGTLDVEFIVLTGLGEGHVFHCIGS